MSQTYRIRIAAFVVFLGIALGALGAHALADQIAATGKHAQWNTATLYHLINGVALFVIALHGGKPRGYWFLLAGIVLFCGCLYTIALTGWTKLGILAPFGGISFLTGWGSWIFYKGKATGDR